MKGERLKIRLWKNDKHVSPILQTEDYLKRKIRTRPERSELIRMHILEGEYHIEPPVCLKSRQV